MSIAVNLKRFTAKQVLALAKNLSDKTNEQINEEMSQDLSTIKRYFNENDTEYYPSLMRLPKLCKTLGNTLILDWINEQIDIHCESSDVDSDRKLLRKVNKISVEMSGIYSTLEKYLDNGSSPLTTKELIVALFDVERQCKEFRCGLQNLTNEQVDDEEWEPAIIKHD